MIVQLLERGACLAVLAGYAREVRRGDGRLVLVAGEAGIGKSALVEQLRNDLTEARWLWGACDGLFTPRPLGPLLDIAGQLGGELEGLCRAGAAREAPGGWPTSAGRKGSSSHWPSASAEPRNARICRRRKAGHSDRA